MSGSWGPWVETRRNLILTPRPSAYEGSGWSTSGGTVTVENGWMRAVTSAASTPYLLTRPIAEAITIGDVVTVRIKVRVDDPKGLTHLIISPHARTGNTYFAPATAARARAITPGVEQVLEYTWTATANVAAGNFDIAVVGGNAAGAFATASIGLNWSFTEASVERTAERGRPFFDGATPTNGQPVRYRWLGTTNNSASAYDTREWIFDPVPVLSQLLGHRTEGFRVDLLKYDDTLLGPLDGVTDVSLRWDSDASISAGGNMQLLDTNQVIDYSSNRIQVWKTVGNEEWPLGIYLMAAPTISHSAEGVSRDVTLIDKMVVIRDDCITQTLQAPSGTLVTDFIRAQLLATGETRLLLTPSGATLTNAMSWEPGTSRLRIINDLLAVINYWSLSTDRWGQFVVLPYSTPSSRPLSWEFRDNELSLHSPDWEHEIPLWDATNHVTYVSQENDAKQVWVATAIDDNPDSPTSTVNMHRVLNPIVEENVEASSQADLQAKAAVKLRDNSNVVGTLSVSHAFLPLWHRDTISFESQGVSVRASITEMSMSLEPGALVDAKWRQI